MGQYHHIIPHLKEMFSGGFDNLSAGFLFCLLSCEATAPEGSAGPIGVNKESTQGHGLTIAEPCLSYCGGEGWEGAPPIKQVFGFIKRLE